MTGPRIGSRPKLLDLFCGAGGRPVHPGVDAMTVIKPPFAYFGGKTTLAERIVSLLPEHRHYVEPFAGSLAVLLAKPRVQFETVNDLDHRLMTFWRVLRERTEDLMRACALTPHSRAEHQVLWCNRPLPQPHLFTTTEETG